MSKYDRWLSEFPEPQYTVEPVTVFVVDEDGIEDVATRWRVHDQQGYPCSMDFEERYQAEDLAESLTDDGRESGYRDEMYW